MKREPDLNIDFHIGKLIKAELARQGRTATWLAKQVNCTPENIYKICRQQWITMHLLFEISKALDHDFFASCSALLDSHKHMENPPVETEESSE